MNLSTLTEQEHSVSLSDDVLNVMEIEGTAITAPDLIAEIENNQRFDTKLRRMMNGHVRDKQIKRNEIEAARSGMTPVQRRRNITREILTENPLDRADIHHIHSVLALCGLPYKRPTDGVREYRHRYGRLSLTVQAGDIGDPYTGDAVPQGLPYGPKARLLMLHVCTRALRQKSPVVELEDSLSGFIRSLGFSTSGGQRGPYNAFKEQLNRLAASRMQIILWNGTRTITINTNPISSFDVWLPPSKDPDQKMLWNSTITLSRDFYESLQKHALPVDIRALSALSHSAKQMDLLLWLSYRLKEMDKPYFLTWDLMKEQFCQSQERRMVDFQRQFRQDIQDIEEIFSKDIPVEMSERGLLLKPCDPEGLFVPPQKKLPKGKS